MKYFQGEFFNKFETNKNNIIVDDEEINSKYMQGEVRIVTEQGRYPLPTLNGLFSDKKKYNMRPEFQRRRRWNNLKKSKLIESFIINVPIPPVFLYEVDYAKFEVMDGLQRISTIIDFYNDKFALEGLEIWSELNGKKYSQLPEKIVEGIDRRYLSSIVLLNESAKSKEQAEFLKKIVFERLNSGGVKLSSQETRNALYDGPFNQLCIQLSNNEDFQELWEINQIDDKDLNISDDLEESKSELYRNMGDVELVLRFFAFRFLDNYNYKLERFLDDFLKTGNKFTKKVFDNYGNLFSKTVELALLLFGENAFKQYKKVRGKWGWRDPSRLIYDPMMQVLSKYVDIVNDVCEKNLDKRIDELKKFYEEYEENFNGKKQSKVDIKTRIDLINSLILKIIE